MWFPLAKSKNNASDKRMISGLASDESIDLEKEKVIMKGMDFETYFLKSGYFNFDHKVKDYGPEMIVGEPTDAKIMSLDKGGYGFFVEGFLYKGKRVADALWEHINALDKSEATRKLGYSVEGKILLRKSGKIYKSIVMNCAITHQPINPRTYVTPMAFVKSLDERKWCKCGGDTSCTGCTKGCLTKALDVGYGEPVGSTGGDAVRAESLDAKVKVQTYDLKDIPSVAKFIMTKGYSKKEAGKIAKLFKKLVINK